MCNSTFIQVGQAGQGRAGLQFVSEQLSKYKLPLAGAGVTSPGPCLHCSGFWPQDQSSCHILYVLSTQPRPRSYYETSTFTPLLPAWPDP